MGSSHTALIARNDIQIQNIFWSFFNGLSLCRMLAEKKIADCSKNQSEIKITRTEN